MAAILLSTGKQPAGPGLSDNCWDNACKLLNSRSPGRINEFNDYGIQIAWTGDDACVHARDNQVIITDGYPCIYTGNPNEIEIIGRNNKDYPDYLCSLWRADRKYFLEHLDGSFSICLYDVISGELTLVRDRFGTRPLFYAEKDQSLIVASECKILAEFIKPGGIDAAALGECLKYRWVTGPSYLFKSFHQVSPATAVTWQPERGFGSRRYWQLQFNPDNDSNIIERYIDLTESAIRSTFRSSRSDEKPIGVLLSGGIDSSIIAAIARQEFPSCIGYIGRLGGDHDEELYRSLQIAKHLDMEYRVVDIDLQRFNDDLTDITKRIEVPPHHQNNLVLKQLLKKASEEVRVILHGDGAEMLFGLSDSPRTERFRTKRKIINRLLPRGMQLTLAHMISWFNKNNALYRRIERLLKQTTLEYAADLDAIEYTIQVQRKIDAFLADNKINVPLNKSCFHEHENFHDALQAYQAYTFLQSSLVRYDRLSQPYGVEAVSPFLSAQVVEVAQMLPRSLRFTDHSKPVLHALCDRFFPPEVSRWPKLGFPVPWKEWLTAYSGPLRERAMQSNVLSSYLPFDLIDVMANTHDPEAVWTLMTINLLIEEYLGER